MKLSEAIRLAGTKYKQSHGTFITYDSYEQVVEACAIGGAIAVSVDDVSKFDWNASSIHEIFPILGSHPINACSVCGAEFNSLDCKIFHMNDDHSMTFDEIATSVAFEESGRPDQEV